MSTVELLATIKLLQKIPDDEKFGKLCRALLRQLDLDMHATLIRRGVKEEDINAEVEKLAGVVK